MSLRYVHAFAQELPYAIRTQVVDYARSVDEAAEDIFSEANRKMDAELRDQLTFIAAIRKLHVICSSSYWILYNSRSILGSEVPGIRVGSRVYSAESSEYAVIRTLLTNLEETLTSQGLDQNLLHGSYTGILEAISDGRRQN